MMRAAMLGVVLLAWAGLAMAQPAKAPAQGVLVSAEAGDIACYLGIRDESGQSRRWMAEFELCEGARARIGRRYALTWREGNVQHPDCQGNPDCRRSQRVLLVVGLKPL
jgi:hypothetical protein